MIQIVNALSLSSDTVADEDLAVFILGGLRSDYDPLVNAITTRPGHEALSIDEIQGLLLNRT